MTPRVTLLAATLVAGLSAPAFASQCPMHVEKIDAAMAGANLSQEQKAEVARLRDEGQRLHSEGKHQQSMETLAKAEKMLGVM